MAGGNRGHRNTVVVPACWKRFEGGRGNRLDLHPGYPSVAAAPHHSFLSFTSASCTFSLLLPPPLPLSPPLLPSPSPLLPARLSPIFITACCSAVVLALISCDTGMQPSGEMSYS